MGVRSEVDVEVFAFRNAPEDVLRAVHGLEVAFELESRPDEPPTPFEAFVADYRGRPSFHEVNVALARVAGEVAAASIIEIGKGGDNAHLVEAWTNVAPTHRRQGLARRLLDPLLDIAEEEERTLMFGFTASSVPSGGAFLERLGAEPGLVERESELELAELDRRMVELWAEEAPGRAPDYELLVIEGPLPDELVEGFADLYAASNDAPRDTLQMEDERRTPEQVRDREKAKFESGLERVLCIARHRSTGELAGWTELGRHPDRPWRMDQYWTAVANKHRGHGLGKWIKAVNLLRAMDRWPDATKVMTGNAYTNDAMLGINNALGFQETIAWTVWQLPIERVREYARSARLQ